MAAQGVPMHSLQEMLGHRDFATTLVYADYAPSSREAEWVEAAFEPTSGAPFLASADATEQIPMSPSVSASVRARTGRRTEAATSRSPRRTP